LTIRKISKHVFKQTMWTDSPQKGIIMTTVRFADYLNIERNPQPLAALDSKEWSDFMRSYKVKQRHILTVS